MVLSREVVGLGLVFNIIQSSSYWRNKGMWFLDSNITDRISRRKS